MTRQSWLFPLLLIGAASCYFQSVRFGFVFADHDPIGNNVLIRDLSQFPSFFTNPHTQAASTNFSLNVYRPLQTLSFALNYRMGGLDPRVYHATNLALHLLCAVLLMVLGRMLGLKRGGALFSALLFIVHPAAVESVTWTADRSGSMSLAGGLLSIILSLKYFQRQEKRYLLFSLLTYACALFSNERAVCFLPMFLAMDFILSRKDAAASVPVRVRIWSYSTHFCLILGYLLARSHVIGSNQQLFEYWGGNFWSNFGNGMRTWPRYLSTLIWPVRLQHYVLWETSSRLIEREVIASGGLLLLTFVLLAELESNPLYSALPALSLAWILIFLLPFPLFVPIGYSPFQVHHLYASLAGFCFWFGCLWDWLGRKERIGKFLGKSALVVLLIASHRITFQENKAWRDGMTWLKHELILHPEPADRHFIQGTILINTPGRKEGAAEEFTQALESNPEPNLKGAIYLQCSAIIAQSQPRIARMAAWGSLLTRQNNVSASLQELGVTLSLEGRFKEALRWYEEELSLVPREPKIYLSISSTYSGLKEYDKAATYCRRALDMKPSFAEAYANLGEIYYQKKDFSEAVKNYRECLKINPDWQFAKEGLERALKKIN